MCELCYTQQGTVDTWIFDPLVVVFFVELLERPEDWDFRPLEPWQSIDLVPQRISYLLEEGFGENARVPLSVEVGQKTVCVERLISKEEIRHLIRHYVRRGSVPILLKLVDLISQD